MILYGDATIAHCARFGFKVNQLDFVTFVTVLTGFLFPILCVKQYLDQTTKQTYGELRHSPAKIICKFA